jgi:DNA modification methylase
MISHSEFLGPFELDKVHCGHVMDLLPQLPPETIQVVCTSPPYWGLRDYGLEPQIWGGEKDCGHVWQRLVVKGISGGTASEMVQVKGKSNFQIVPDSESALCQLCGAWRGELGLEPQPELYLEHMISVFRGVWRVLRKDGCLWVNIGDSYASNNKGHSFSHNELLANKARAKRSNYNSPAFSITKTWNRNVMGVPPGLKPKDLCMIPARLALALQADGWWLRSDIIWAKPNPMPESCTDRPTKSYEHIFLLTKSAKYYWDADAVREPSADVSRDTYQNPIDHLVCSPPANGRNMRDVWTLSTEPTTDAHFATYPLEIPRRAIKAGSKQGDIVLDPFCGSGKTGQAALELGRQFIGIDLNPTYCAEIAAPRIEAARQGVTVKELEQGQKTLW